MIDPTDYLISEAIAALNEVWPEHTVHLVQAAINAACESGKWNAGDQLALLEANDLLRHLNGRRAYLDGLRREDGRRAYWEDNDPLRGNGKPRLTVYNADDPPADQ